VNTYLSVNKGEPAFSFVDHHNCRLGKWYYDGEGQQFFSCSDHYAALEQPHATVHQGTKLVFDLIDAQNMDYSALMEAFEVMEHASGKVFDGLNQIKSDSGRN